MIPPFGTNPPSGPVSPYESDLSARAVSNDPRESWYLTFPSKLAPKQVLQILRSALGGDLWQSFMLCQLMLDTWPMFAKCAHELRTAVSQTKFEVKPFTVPGAEPTKSAKEKADLVAMAMQSFAPDPFTDEKEFTGLVYHLTDPILNGTAIEEIIWREPQEAGNGRWVRLPRAASFVHPRHFTWGNDGRILLFDEEKTRYDWAPYGLGRRAFVPDPDKFICGQFLRSGGALGAGFMRPLAWYWSAMVFNKEWMLTFAQKYGQPFLDIAYKPGMNEAEMAKLEDFASKAGNQGYLLHPEGSEVNIHPAGSLGPDNAQRHIKDEANEQCQLLLLGQTATTTPTPGKLGNDTQHGKVRREYVEMAAGWTAANPLKQFARQIVRVNYGEETEVPEFVSDFTEAASPADVAQTWNNRLSSGLPFDAEEYYKENSTKMPEPGDLIVVKGFIGRMGENDLTVEVGPQPLPAPEPGEPGQGQGNLPNRAAGEPSEPSDIKAIIKAATREELKELRRLIVVAKEAPHQNGELAAVHAKVADIAARRLRSVTPGKS